MSKLPRRARLAPLILAVLGLAAFAAPAAAIPCETGCEEQPPENLPPEASFSVSNDTPVRGETVTLQNLSSDPDGDPLTVSWDLDGNGTYGERAGEDAVTVTYPALGSRTVGIRVSDGRAVRTTVEVITVVNRAPSASFTLDKPAPLTNESVTFTSTSADPDGDALTQTWDLDGDGAYDDGAGATVQRAFAVPGQYPIKLRVTDGHGGSAVSEAATVTVHNRVPSAEIAFGPATPLTGETITFDSAASSDPDGSIAARAWDVDDDGAFDDGAGTTATQSFATPGTHVVRVQVTDDRGATATTTATVTVGNRAPTASFAFAPLAPVAGEQVTFDAAASSDPEGALASYAWDLDGNGSYETVTGATARAAVSYASAGTVTVGLRVTDAHGATSETTRTVIVAPKPDTGGQKPGGETPGGQTPGGQTPGGQTPVQERVSVPVKAKWTVSKKKGTKVARLVVGPVPAGASVEVTCKGKGCSFAKKAFGTGTVDLAKQFKKRLKAGAVITITAARPGSESQVTRYTVQRKAKPKLG